METPILILEDALIQQKEQLKQLKKKRIFHNPKQEILVNKAINNVKVFIAEIEEALNILKPNELKGVSNNENTQKICIHKKSEKCDKNYMCNECITYKLL